MKPNQFDPKSRTGRLVEASFYRIKVGSGKFKEMRETGWAFMPDPMPELQQALEQSGELLARHGDAMALLGRLDGRFQDNPGGVNINPWVLYQPLRVREARLSSKIENTVASALDIEAALIIPTERSEPLEVANYIRAIEMGVKNTGPITESLIRALHAELLRDVPNAEKKLPGEYRSRQVMIGDEGQSFSAARFAPPPPGEVPMLMRQLVEYIQNPPKGMPILFVAAIAHYQFETIHPFADGNGRLGRMLITLSLCDDTLLSKPLIYPSGYINQNKQRYYDLLLGVSTHGDWHSWFKYFLDVVVSEAGGADRRITRLFQLRQDYLGRVEDKSLGPRFIDSIDYLFEQSVITVKMLHKRIGGTTQTARNYIELMVDRGILCRVLDQKKPMVYFAPEIHDVANED